MSTVTLDPQTTDIGRGTTPPMVHFAEDEWVTHAICGAPLKSTPGCLIDAPVDCVVCAELEAAGL